MSNTSTLLRSLLIYSLCLPLAIYIGFSLATPESGESLLLVGLVMLLLVLPVLLRFHHGLLILSINMSAVMFFLKGNPELWLVMAVASLGISVVQRALKPEMRFLNVSSVTVPLIFLVVVIFFTAQMTGGMGFRAMGGSTYGGKRYLMLLGGIMVYFALLAQKIPSDRARVMVGAYLLSALTAMIANLSLLPGSWWNFVFLVFPADPVGLRMAAGDFDSGFGGSILRFGGVAVAAQAVFCFMLAYYGIRRLLDLRRPWRLATALIVASLSLFGGFRSSLIFFTLIFALIFWLEGLWRTRFLPIVLLATVLAVAITLPFVKSFPTPVQRALSVLPIEVDPVAAMSAQDSTEWRLHMWEVLLPEVPRYLLVGKGYAINSQDLELAYAGVGLGRSDTAEIALLAGDYHSGPLSTIIPLGIWGLIGLLWFFTTAGRVLYRNHKYSEPTLQPLNNFLVAYFLAKIFYFFFIFGSLYSDLFAFTSIVGLSICLNGGMRRPNPAEPKSAAAAA